LKNKKKPSNYFVTIFKNLNEYKVPSQHVLKDSLKDAYFVFDVNFYSNEIL